MWHVSLWPLPCDLMCFSLIHLWQVMEEAGLHRPLELGSAESWKPNFSISFHWHLVGLGVDGTHLYLQSLIELRGSKFIAKPFHWYPLISRLFATEPQPRPWLCASGKDALFVLLTKCQDGQLVLYIGCMQQRFKALRGRFGPDTHR